MRLLSLNEYLGEGASAPIWVNQDHITHLTDGEKMLYAEVHLLNGRKLSIKETPLEIIKKIEFKGY